MKISIVVPVYKTEKLISKCIESILSQSFSDFELILIDDGSPDASGKVCDEYALKDTRVRVIHKANEGPGLTRNAGIKAAGGEYIVFVDSDDHLPADSLKKRLEAIEDSKTEGVWGGLYKQYNDNTELWENDLPHIIESEEMILSILGTDSHCEKDVLLEPGPWLAIYKKSIIDDNGLLFRSEKEVFKEDYFFNVDYLLCCKKVCNIPDPVYVYNCTNFDSFTRKYIAGLFERQLHFRKEIMKRIDGFKYEKEAVNRINRTFLGEIRVCVEQEIACPGKKPEDAMKLIKEISENETVKEVLASYPIGDGPFRQKIFNYCLKKKLDPAVYLITYLKCRI